MLCFDVISQGEEIVSGVVVDTNASAICRELGALGLVPARITTVGDTFADIRDVITEAARRSVVVVCTGGLGPTTDDLTSEAAAAAFGLGIEENPVALAQIVERYASRKRPMPPTNRKQAVLPIGATVLENRLGTAPGFCIDTARIAGASSPGTLLFFLPGPPFEMNAMLKEHVIPAVLERFSIPKRRTVVLRCIGIAESVAGEKMAGFERPGVTIGYRAALPEIHVKLHLEEGVDAGPLIAEARERLGDVVFGVDTGPLAEVIGRALAARGETLAVAESCTSGRLAAAITAIPGASEWFLGGALVYSNAEKVRQCGVSEQTLAAHGAVSEATARELADGLRARMGASWVLSVTGIAGPGGGTPEKPVGTVHFALAGPGGTRHRHVRLPYDRDRNLAFSVGTALDLLRRTLQGLEA
jgi:nicotinamide-nucleotide amidase